MYDHSSKRAGRLAMVAGRRPVGTVPRLTHSPVARHGPPTPTGARRPRRRPPVPPPPAVDRPLRLVDRSPVRISPKSVDATGTGLVFAQNMMYRHTMTVYDVAGSLVKTIPDGVDLASFGYPGHAGLSRGAPVEGAVSPDRRFFYVTNYSMYGAGFGPEGSDNCSGPQGLSPSFVYRVELKRLAITGVTQVGMVPKYIAVTPDNRYILVTNWCSFDLSVVDRAAFKEVRRIHLGTDPRGIAVNKSSSVAYVVVMGSTESRASICGRSRSVVPGRRPVAPPGRARPDRSLPVRHAQRRQSGHEARHDHRHGDRAVATGSRPRSMVITPDGTALYVVNYGSNTVTKLRASDMSIVQTIAVPSHPIGITFEP